MDSCLNVFLGDIAPGFFDMKIPSRAKLEKDLARLKRAAGIRAEVQKDSPNPANNSSFSPDLMSRIEGSFGKLVDFLGKIPTLFPKETPDLSGCHRSNNHDIARIIQVASDEPRLYQWFLALKTLPLERRAGELQRMADTMRQDPYTQDLAEILDHLHSAPIYESFCQVLQEERKMKHA